jgi:hypothetical protein
MAKDVDKLALTETALEEIREAIYEPRTTLAKVRRHVGRILGKLREQTGEDVGTSKRKLD